VVYRCVATSPAGFVQQLAVSYVGHGYWFYVTGSVPERKDPLVVDQKLVARYGIDVSKWARARRKRQGLANLHYLRFGRFFVLIATPGEHRFFQEEKGIRDVRRDSVRFGGYSVGYKRDRGGKWHPSVRIHPETYRDVKAYFLELANHRSSDELAMEFGRLQFVPFAPVRVQLVCVLRAVNAERKTAGIKPVPVSVLRLKRTSVAVFESRQHPGLSSACWTKGSSGQ
jgi:hypothetical protein